MRPFVRASQLAVITVLLLSTAVHAGAGEDKKRRDPVDVPALVAGGLKYEAPRLGTPFGYAQDGGIVTARRADSGELVWTRRVYTTSRDPHMESDKQDVFINSLTLSADGRHLDIANERGQRFEIRLDGSGVRALR